jgi:hypothetical protein
MNPSKKVSSQGACPLFKLAVELRNEIYSLAFTAETNEDDGSIELNENAKPPNKALVTTCQVIWSGTRAIYKAAYQDYPKHTFTLTVRDRSCPDPTFATSLSNDILAHLTSIRLHWRADERNNNKQLRMTSRFDRVDHEHRWTAQVEMHDVYWRGEDRAERLIRWYGYNGFYAMEKFRLECSWQSGQRLSDALAFAVARTGCATPSQEHSMWRVDEVPRFGLTYLRNVSFGPQNRLLTLGIIV